MSLESAKEKLAKRFEVGVGKMIHKYKPLYKGIF